MAQSSVECPGARMTFREGLVGGSMSEDGAMDEVESTFVGGTRSMEAAEGGGLNAAPFVGRGGGGIALKVGAFKRGGSSDWIVVGAGTPFPCGAFWAGGACLRSDDSPEGIRESDGVDIGLRETFSSGAAAFSAELWPFDVDVPTCC